MGVQGLNNIIKKCPQEKGFIYKRVIIDGSNLVFTKLSRYLSQLKKLYGIDDWKSVDKDLVFQIKFIIENSVNDIAKVINICKSKFKAEEIFLVLDPTKTPGYIVNPSMKFASSENDDSILKDNKYILTILQENEVINNQTIEFNIKSDEQETRKKRNNKSDSINAELEKIERMGIGDEIDLLMVKSIYQQSYFFNSANELIKLSRPVMLKIEQMFFNDGVYIIDAEDEADLVIKNIAHNNINFDSSLSDDYLTLIMSADTDYHILFSDSANVHVTTLVSNDPIYSPYRCWHCFLEDAYSYDAVIRIAPILGNDYTTHESLITAAKNPNDVRNLFNIDGHFKELKNNARKKIYSVVCNYKLHSSLQRDGNSNETDKITSVLEIDDMIYKYNINYFKKYFLSTIIYKNWNVYNRCTIRNDSNNNRDKNTLESEIVDSIIWILERIIKQFTVIYQWNSQYLFTNWELFIENIVTMTFKTTEEFYNYYNSINALEDDYGSEYIDDICENVNESEMKEQLQDYCDEYI